MQKYVKKNIPRPTDEILSVYKKLDVSTVYEAQGRQGLLDYSIKGIQSGVYLVGAAVTVTCPAGDNLMIHAAIEVCEPGDILVITTIGEDQAGMIGELIVTALMKKGVKGIITDSGIRDVSQLRSMKFPVWSQSVTSRGTTKSRGGWVNAPAVCGGVLVHPGDLILADDDVVVVVKRADFDSSLQSSLERLKKEEQTKEKIESGQFSLDFYNLRPVLENEGVVYYDNEQNQN